MTDSIEITDEVDSIEDKPAKDSKKVEAKKKNPIHMATCNCSIYWCLYMHAPIAGWLPVLF